MFLVPTHKNGFYSNRHFGNFVLQAACLRELGCQTDRQYSRQELLQINLARPTRAADVRHGIPDFLRRSSPVSSGETKGKWWKRGKRGGIRLLSLWETYSRKETNWTNSRGWFIFKRITKIAVFWPSQRHSSLNANRTQN